jgi:hypothetical protein
MNINIKDVLTLSDENKYCVVSKTEYQGKMYYYLIDLNDSGNIKFCFQNQNELTEVEDAEEIRKLIPLFYDAAKDILKELIESNK